MVCPILIWGSISGCDIVTRPAISGKWKLVPFRKHLLARVLRTEITPQLTQRNSNTGEPSIAQRSKCAGSELTFLTKPCGRTSLFQIVGQECYCAIPCIRGIVGTISRKIFVVGIFGSV